MFSPLRTLLQVNKCGLRNFWKKPNGKVFDNFELDGTLWRRTNFFSNSKPIGMPSHRKSSSIFLLSNFFSPQEKFWWLRSCVEELGSWYWRKTCEFKKRDLSILSTVFTYYRSITIIFLFKQFFLERKLSTQTLMEKFYHIFLEKIGFEFQRKSIVIALWAFPQCFDKTRHSNRNFWKKIVFFRFKETRTVNKSWYENAEKNVLRICFSN